MEAFFVPLADVRTLAQLLRCKSSDGHSDASTSLCCSCNHAVSSEPSIPPFEQEAALRSRLGGPALPVSDLRLALPPAEQIRASRSRFSTVQVPLEFDEYQSRGRGPALDQHECLQACLRTFARTMLRGCFISLLLDDGATVLAEVAMDSDLTHLVVHVQRFRQTFPLMGIEHLCAPSAVLYGRGMLLADSQLDERSCAVTFEGGQFLTFVFDSSRTRKYFEVGLLFLIMVSKSGAKRAPSPDAESSHFGSAMPSVARV